jgi:hypothetical protein
MERPRVDLKKAESARPRRGTEFGDATIGTCEHQACHESIARWESFVATLAGSVYHRRCWEALPDDSRQR